MREALIEAYLVDQVRAAGGFCWKWQSTRRGVPDRIVFLPGGRTIYVELKAPNGRLSAQQQHVHGMLRDLGHDVRVVWSKEHVDALIREVTHGATV